MVQPSIIFILYILLLKQFIIHSHEIFIAYIGTIRYNGDKKMLKREQ